MSITITQTPNLIALAGSRKPFKFYTTNLYSAAGSLAVMQITINGNTVAGQSFKLAWGNYEFTFLCATTPNTSGVQFLPYTGDYALSALKLYECLSTNYYITKDFRVSIAGAMVSLLARNVGTAYSLTYTNGATTMPHTLSNTAGTNQVVNANFRIVARVKTNNTIIAEEALTSFVAQTAEMDPSEYMLPEFVPEFDFPETLPHIKPRTGMLLAYVLEYAEAYGDPLFVYKLATSATFRLLNGGISREMESLYNQTPVEWWIDWAGKKRFLTLAPVEKRVDWDALEKLYFVSWNKHTEEIYINIKLTKYDTLDSSTVLDSILTVDQYMVYEINCSLPDLKPMSHEDDIKKIDLWLTDQDGVTISETRTFVLNHRTAAQTRTFIFMNSFGVYETLHCTGEAETTNALERTEALRILPAGFTRRTREVQQYNLLETRSIKANTGYQFTLAHQDWLRDFLLTREAFEVIGGRLMPVNITSDKHKLYTDNEGLYALDFEYTPAYRNEHFGIEPASIIEHDSGITGFTGGGRSNLDGRATVDVPDFSLSVYIDNELLIYHLRAGDTVTHTPDSVRPADYDEHYNQKYWELIYQLS